MANRLMDNTAHPLEYPNPTLKPRAEDHEDELGFIQPNPQELCEAGIEPTLIEANRDWRALIESQASLIEQWRALDKQDQEEGSSSLEILALLGEHLHERPQAWRELLVMALAKEEGYTRRFHKKKQGMATPLFDLLIPSRFAALSAQSEDVLWAIADSTTPARRTLHPIAAIGALALWRNSARYSAKAAALLRARPLPDDPQWLMALVRQLHRKAKTPERDLLRLAQQQLESKFWNVAALLSALGLLERHGRPSTSPLNARLERVCDHVSQAYPHQEAVWLQLIADATLGGQLDHPWLERIIEACIRLSIDDPAREQRLRAYHSSRPYEADAARYRRLYAPHLKLYRQHLRKPSVKIPTALNLEREALRLSKLNPLRAQHLLELLAIEQIRRRARLNQNAAHERRLSLAFIRCEQPDGLLKTLAQLIVKNVDISASSAQFIRRIHGQINWDEAEHATRQELELYLVISDYERAFKHLTCKYDGLTVHHVDKHAVERLKYFIQKRLEPGSLSRMMDTASAPIQWVGQQVASTKFLQHLVAQAISAFEQRSLNLDLSAQVLEDLQETGIRIERFDQIASLGLDQLHDLLNQQRNQRILIGALSGGISGGLAPMSWSVISLADIPVLLGLAADICNRFCWYFGFDPRVHSDLPMTILAVALGGSKPQAIEPLLLRQNLQEFVVRKSFMVSSLSPGAVIRVASKTFNNYMESRLGHKLAAKAQALAKRAVSQNLQQRAASASASKHLPLFGAVLGAALNGALIYDICEAAQAVLTDRFLERKYPQWIRKFELKESAPLALPS